jgi:hypothetical protein
MLILEFVEETFGISSSSTSRGDHEARDKSRHAMNMTPNDPRTEVSTCKSSGTQPEKSEACIARIQALTVEETMSKAYMQVHTNKGSQEKQPVRKLGPNRAVMGLGRLASADRPSPLRARFGAPFALGACLFIASAAGGRHMEQIILPMPFTRKPPPQDEGESCNIPSFDLHSNVGFQKQTWIELESS